MLTFYSVSAVSHYWSVGVTMIFPNVYFVNILEKLFYIITYMIYATSVLEGLECLITIRNKQIQLCTVQ